MAEKTNKVILSIGDIHGLDLWKDLTHGSTYDFANWKLNVDEGVPASADFWKDMPYMNYDKIVFVGDYVDSFTISNEVIKNNLLDIIYFKKALPDKVVLILGNHDVQYIVPNQLCSGYRSEMRIDLQQIFKENLGLFKVAHLEKFNNAKWIWTHGGVTTGWLKEAKDFLKKPDRFHDINRPYAYKQIDKLINWLWESNASVLYQCDRDSGGYSRWAGPLWVRTGMLNTFYIKGYNQIVGHTPKSEIKMWEYRYKNQDFTLYHIDCLERSKNGLVLTI